MCNRRIVDPEKQDNQHLMDTPSSTAPSAFGSNPSSAPGSTTGSNDEVPRVKFLCSFLGSILPRPQDGKLRYVGGETRIVSLPRDITYEELMSKMRELYEGAAVLKYQQPDEDLDALVSVVNDDDVTNMMEEYEKLGSCDGFTRLRIFLFSHPEQDGSSHYGDGDERETERRYVDALNSLNEGSDFRKCESPIATPITDGIHLAEQLFNPMNIDGGLHNQWPAEMSMPPYNLHHLSIPRIGSGQLQLPASQRCNEMEGSWSPAFYSPRHHGHHDPRTLSDFPASPSAGHYRVPFPEIPDKYLDRMPEEYVRQQLNPHPTYEHHPQFSDNVVWMPTGAISGDKAGFTGNVLHGLNLYEGNNVCEHCRATFNRHQPHLEHPSMGNGVPQIANPCAECSPNRESYMVNADSNLHIAMYPKDQMDARSPYSEMQSHERGWVLPHQLNPCVEDARNHAPVAGKLNDHCIVDGPTMNFPHGHGNLADAHHMPSNYVHHRPGPDIGTDVFHDQALVTPSHLHIPLEERGFRYGNYPYAYGGDNLYPASHGHVHGQTLWRNVQNTGLSAPRYEASILPQHTNSTVNSPFLRDTAEGSARFCVGVDNQNTWAKSSQKMLGLDGTVISEHSYAHPLKLNTIPNGRENPQLFPPPQEPIQSSHDMLNVSTSVEPVQLSDPPSTLIPDKSASGKSRESQNDSNATGAVAMEEKSVPVEGKEVCLVEKIENSEVPSIPSMEPYKVADIESKISSSESSNSDCLRPAEDCGDAVTPGKTDACALENSNLSINNLSFLPELIASVKKAALEEVEEVKAKVDDGDSVKKDSIEKEVAANELESANACGELEMECDNENLNTSKIEPTKAEAEAIARGLQTIKNDDLEEIRELGSGTYGAVYHGKWKGSDVAIKRIKASCFAGRPSERERLIADFWKEALILSSLHHPNVVSFYGIVRDGPDGSLATVTEFMVNGSLKQFLRKKDRTIDRRKRLIIGMDAAFGMEYLHGKNIVHFDLKCENLLVNMRDPQRPVCKIGDLGLSKVRQHTLVSGGVRGTLPWMAPELLSGKSNMVTEKIDVYSFGIVMWELLTGEEPYADMHCASIIGGIVNNTLRPKIPSWCDPEWKALMEKCWASDPSERPSFSEISQKLRNMAAAINCLLSSSSDPLHYCH
ncbi:hypothetical protein SLE2022_150950 [Rubroshorea leprosula]